ncbi:MAG: 3-phosphoshikimate 1-carboxyvinyltransferase [Anaerolineae bacterium]|nr:3-phosphoshikimate 1-carboxyvinyltransferase [Anaerolineae bacterium]
MDVWIRPGRRLRGEVRVPGDKSIAHRALILAALGEGESEIRGFDPLDDSLRTLEALRACGAAAEMAGPGMLRIAGRGPKGLGTPAGVLHCGLSGTTMRLLAGVLAGQPLAATLDGDPPLRRRPMDRVVEPLRRMGARIEAADAAGHAPLSIRGGGLRGIDYTLPVASAQVKSAILLAGLSAEGVTVVHEPVPSRDHTERMLRWLGVPVEVRDGAIRLVGGARWRGRAFALPGDISAAAFFLVAASLVPGSEVFIGTVGLNPTRSAVLEVLRRMGVEVIAIPTLPEGDADGPEPTADLVARSAALRAVTLEGALIPNLIDELPVLAVAATQAEGVTVVRDASELRVKESDRIAAVAQELGAMGARIEAMGDGFVVEGPTPLRGVTVDAHGDHRMAMALAVAALVAKGETVIRGAETVTKSFPGFFAALRALGAEVA